MEVFPVLNMKTRPTKTSVTNFLHHGNNFLFIIRSSQASINAGELNGTGGKLEPKENYITAAIRETKEETGYRVTKKDIEFCGIIKFESKDTEDWITCFYKIKVPSTKIPLGENTKEGKLVWINKDKVLNSDHKLVDDLRYIWKDVVKGKETFFITAQVVGKEFKIINITSNKLPKHYA